MCVGKVFTCKDGSPEGQWYEYILQGSESSKQFKNAKWLLWCQSILTPPLPETGFSYSSFGKLLLTVTIQEESSVSISYYHPF